MRALRGRLYEHTSDSVGCPDVARLSEALPAPFLRCGPGLSLYAMADCEATAAALSAAMATMEGASVGCDDDSYLYVSDTSGNCFAVDQYLNHALLGYPAPITTTTTEAATRAAASSGGSRGASGGWAPLWLGILGALWLL